MPVVAVSNQVESGVFKKRGALTGEFVKFDEFRTVCFCWKSQPESFSLPRPPPALKKHRKSCDGSSRAWASPEKAIPAAGRAFAARIARWWRFGARRRLET